jgi:hypothetical protein
MGGIDWSTVGRQTFDQIADTLLAREFGTRGYAVDGRGGDEGHRLYGERRQDHFPVQVLPGRLRDPLAAYTDPKIFQESHDA